MAGEHGEGCDRPCALYQHWGAALLDLPDSDIKTHSWLLLLRLQLPQTRKLDHHIAISSLALQKSDCRYHRRNNQDVRYCMRQHVSYDGFRGFGECVMPDQLPYLLL